MLKVVILVAYFALMIGIGLYCRKTATDVNGFVLGGRSVAPGLPLLHMVRRTFQR